MLHTVIYTLEISEHQLKTMKPSPGGSHSPPEVTLTEVLQPDHLQSHPCAITAGSLASKYATLPSL